MTVNLEQVSYGDTSYIAKLETNRQIIEAALNELYGYLSGGQAGSPGAVPLGLQEIFDRRGFIGIASYDFSEGTLTGPNYNLTVAAGAYWYPGAFYRKATGTTLSLAGKATGTYYLNLDATGTPILGTSANTTTSRQFSWNETTHQVSNKALYAGVAVLFDGDDYADLLTSAVKGKSFEKAADRLEEIEAGVDIFGGYYAQDLPHSGLNFKYQAGQVRNDSAVSFTPAGQVALTDNQTNYVEVDPADGTVSANTTGFTSGRVPLFVVVTAAGVIDTITDKRTPAMAGTGGGGGGHTQGTDTGTTATSFLIDSDAAGSPTGRAGIEVENGDDPNAAIKFNRDTGKWQYSEDGGATWRNLGDYDPDPGSQTITQFVAKENPDKVFEELGRGSSIDYEDLDLSSYVAAPLGVEAVALLVYFWDSAPGASVNVLFKKKGSIANPVEGFTVWSGQSDPGLRVVPVDEGVACQFFVNASGADTANLKIYLLGYHKKVVGVGTQEQIFTQVNISCPANSQADLTFENFVNRGLVHYFKIEETSGLPANVYDLHLYADAAFSTLLYKVEGVIPGSDPFEDWLPFWVHDSGTERKLRIRIVNRDLTQAGTYSITIKAEQFI